MRAAPSPAGDFAVAAEWLEDRRGELLDRLLRDYGAPLQATLRRLAHCAWFDKENFEFLVRAFATGQQLDTWAEAPVLPCRRVRVT